MTTESPKPAADTGLPEKTGREWTYEDEMRAKRRFAEFIGLASSGAAKPEAPMPAVDAGSLDEVGEEFPRVGTRAGAPDTFISGAIPETVRDVLDAIDELGRARDLVQLIGMTTDNCTTREKRALAAGAEAAIERIEASLSILRAHVEGARA